MNKKLYNAIVYTVSGSLFLLGIWLIARQFIYVPDKYVAPAETPAASATPAAPTPTPLATPSPTPYIKKAPVTMHFLGKEISCDVLPVTYDTYKDKNGDPVLDENGNEVLTMATIDSEKVAAWLEDGPSPGEYGNALINGHVRWKKKAGVFSILPDMQVDERVAFTYDDGSVKYFHVASVDFFTIDDYPDWVMNMDSGDTRVTLISCYGEWNSAQGTANQRVIVVLKPDGE